MTKTQVLTAIENLGTVTTSKLDAIRTETVSKVLAFYTTLLIDIVLTIGVPIELAQTYSIERLEAMTAKFRAKLIEANTNNKNRTPSLRQFASAEIYNNIVFPINVNEYKELVVGAYAIQYFNLNGCKPTSLVAVSTLWDDGTISLKDGCDADTILVELEKNGKFAAANSYSTSNKYSTHFMDDIDFKLVKTGSNVDKVSK